MPTWLATSQVAWENTARTVFDAMVPFPISDIYWALAASKGASTMWHMDTCGLSTAVHCTYGKKLWIFRRQHRDSACTFGHLLGDNFDLERGYDDSEAILLDNSITMYAFILYISFISHSFEQNCSSGSPSFRVYCRAVCCGRVTFFQHCHPHLVARLLDSYLCMQ